MKQNHHTAERCGDIVLCHAESMTDAAWAIGTTAAMLREVMTQQSLDHEHAWPETWHPGRIDAALVLIEIASEKLGAQLADAIGGDE
ncbi:MAG: hypothetical protein EOM91_21530 [Sphingobacteriia bacterium]|nr:hypothetical protein [Sphingobacteriia bacterium]